MMSPAERAVVVGMTLAQSPWHDLLRGRDAFVYHPAPEKPQKLRDRSKRRRPKPRRVR